jgi:hypothetical protein
MQHRVPINSFEAILVAYAIGMLTAFAFFAHGKLIERSTSTTNH